MAKKLYLEESIQDLADAIRSVNGQLSATYTVGEMASAVEALAPSGNINITSTAQTDVSAYATAQVVDADLVAGNIKKDVDILGVVGTYEGGSGGQSLDDYIAGKLTEVEVTLPSNTQSIGAFTGHSELEKITIKGGGQSLPASCFANCQGLKYLDLPDTLNDTRKSSLFYNVTQMTTLIVRAVTPPQAYASIGLPSSLTAIYVPSGSVAAYKAATGWSSYASIIQAIPE